MRRVLVTRPQRDAALTAAKLEAAGYQPVCLPVSETVATDASLPQGNFDVVAVTSANALRHIEPSLLVPYRHLQLYAVGEKTASVARDAGFETIYAGDGWGLHLGRHVASVMPAGSHVLYLTGKIRRPDFEAQLSAAGINLTVAETYDTRPVTYNDAELSRIADEVSAEVILLYSAVAARQFVALDKQAQGAFIQGAKFIFCLSQRIAAELPACSAQICISDTPDEDALLRLLELC
ncbi:uroporphyrinogen-III synthase [Pseudochrobactrum sp. sp1633]|uniref:uroporphyrinogen-III synthase n=1 Tax=Pseudochrobactrum sp. sp1633 TaxID=3036706 RepID=UPI0025A5B228|nr:uroporphyrinogen-III synthase [Pseudochrobactrum sp. sp1633]MDM8345072.1 uroporphyrinogen-III synthase [Pseudochrobactrum sp. sp1633]HWD14905.1 uroporphyrinogen-III synthase [Pseudochrobactrum sp.]